jgi:hypothetical protein
MTAANAAPELIPKTKTATAMASLKLFEAAVNASVGDLDTPANRPNSFNPQCDDGIDTGSAMRGYESSDQCKYSQQ